MPISLLDTGIVYRNPRPYLRAINAMHPSVGVLPGGRLLASFELGQAPESIDYRGHLSHSDDGGQTWSPPRKYIPERTNRPAITLGRIGVLPDGSVALMGAYAFRDDPEQGVINHATFGYVPMELFTMRSTDGGATWDEPTTINPPMLGPSFEICHRIVQLKDGRWMFPIAPWRGWDGDAPNGMKATVWFSSDRGRTWPHCVTVMDDYANGAVHFEQSIVQLPDERLLAIGWAYEIDGGKTRPTPCAISRPDGTFSPPIPTGLNGQTAKLTALPDGRVLCLYRRHDKPGLWANLSRIDGEKWINLEETALWTGASSGMAGKGPGADELSALKFGFPTAVMLPDGNVFAVFWCTEDGVTNIRWLRVEVK